MNSKWNQEDWRHRSAYQDHQEPLACPDCHKVYIATQDTPPLKRCPCPIRRVPS